MHPEPDRWREVQVRMDDRLMTAGRLERAAGLLADIHNVRRLIDDAVVRGRLRWEAARRFECVDAYDSRDSWEATLASPHVGRLEADEPLLKRAFDLMPAGRAEVLLRQRARAVRLRRG